MPGQRDRETRIFGGLISLRRVGESRSSSSARGGGNRQHSPYPAHRHQNHRQSQHETHRQSYQQSEYAGPAVVLVPTPEGSWHACPANYWQQPVGGWRPGGQLPSSLQWGQPLPQLPWVSFTPPSQDPASAAPQPQITQLPAEPTTPQSAAEPPQEPGPAQGTLIPVATSAGNPTPDGSDSGTGLHAVDGTVALAHPTGGPDDTHSPFIARLEPRDTGNAVRDARALDRLQSVSALLRPIMEEYNLELDCLAEMSPDSRHREDHAYYDGQGTMYVRISRDRDGEGFDPTEMFHEGLLGELACVKFPYGSADHAALEGELIHCFEDWRISGYHGQTFHDVAVRFRRRRRRRQRHCLDQRFRWTGR